MTTGIMALYSSNNYVKWSHAMQEYSTVPISSQMLSTSSIDKHFASKPRYGNFDTSRWRMPIDSGGSGTKHITIYGVWQWNKIVWNESWAIKNLTYFSAECENETSEKNWRFTLTRWKLEIKNGNKVKLHFIELSSGTHVANKICYIALKFGAIFCLFNHPYSCGSVPFHWFIQSIILCVSSQVNPVPSAACLLSLAPCRDDSVRQSVLAIRSADAKNPTLEANMKWIRWSDAEISPFFPCACAFIFLPPAEVLMRDSESQTPFPI